jgi:hypothetical protein
MRLNHTLCLRAEDEIWQEADRERRGPRFTLIPLTAGADASAPAQATGRRHVSATARRAEIRLTVLE